MDPASALRDDNAAVISRLILQADAINTGLAFASHLPILTACPPPLSVACFFNAPDCFSLLLAHGAKVSKADLHGVSPLLLGFRFILRLRRGIYNSLPF
jgi:hypothetical protein